MSHLAQPRITPTRIFRVIHRWRSTTGKIITHRHYYWTYRGAKQYITRTPQGLDEDGLGWDIETADISSFRSVPS